MVKRFLKTEQKDKKEKKKNYFGKTVRKKINLKIQEHALKYLIEKKNTRNGMGNTVHYLGLRIQNSLSSEDMDILKDERKQTLQDRKKMHFKITSHFKQIHSDILYDGCRIEESTAEHTLIGHLCFSQFITRNWLVP